MIVEKFLQLASSFSAITDQTVLLAYLNEAAKEFWDGVDFPNTLKDKSFNLFSTGNALVTLPVDVKAVRGIAPWPGQSSDLYTQAVVVNDDFWQNSPWSFRHVGTSVLHTNISNACQLTIKRKNPKAADEVIFVIGGRTDVASDFRELVHFTDADTTKLTANAYETISVANKDRLTSCDFTIEDPSGTELAVFPNNYDEISHQVIQVCDRCTTCQINCCGGNNCARVLYKPVLPPFWSSNDSIPEGLEGALLYKFREWLDLLASDNTSRAEVMATKATGLATRAAFNREKGTIMPFPVKRNPFIRFPNARV